MFKDVLEQLNNNIVDIDYDMLINLSIDELNIIEEKSNNLSKIYQNIEQSKKKQINTLYGALANSFFPLYDIRLADATTSYGRYYIKSIGNRVNNYLITNYDYNGENSLIYTHTDSTYFTLKPIVDKEINVYIEHNKDFVDLLIDKSKDIMKIIEAQFKYSSILFNSKNPELLKMELESISDKSIWSKASNYFLRNYYQNEKLIIPKIKVVGMEIIKSSTSTFSKNIFKDNLNIFLDSNNNEILNFINNQYEDFEKDKIENISFNKKINNINYYLVDDYNKLTIIDEIYNLKKHLSKIFKTFSNEDDDEFYDTSDLNKKEIYKYLLNIDLHISNGDIDINYINTNIENLINCLENMNQIKYIEYVNNFQNIILKKIDYYINKIKDNFFFDSDDKYIIKKGTNNYMIAAIKFNKYIDEYNLKQFTPIYSGDKIKYVYLKKNNPFDTNIIGFKDYKFIKHIKKWIDYKTQFEKSFISPLTQITSVLDIDTSFKNRERNKSNEINDLFN